MRLALVAPFRTFSDACAEIAMAGFESANPGFDPTIAAQMPNDTALQAAIASAWHHA
jgi:hypothetical protein